MLDGLTLRDNAKSELLKIKTLEGGVDYLNKIKAIEAWAKAEKKDAELQNIVAEQKLRTQRILGRLIKEAQYRSEVFKKGENKSNSLITADDKEKKSLAEIGITPNQSSNFQKIFSIPEETFEEAIAKHKQAVNDAALELTTMGFLRLAKELAPSEADHDDRVTVESFNKSKLTSLREEAKISQYELAMQSGVETCTISRLESGKVNRPTFDVVARFAECFTLLLNRKVVMEDFKLRDLL